MLVCLLENLNGKKKARKTVGVPCQFLNHHPKWLLTREEKEEEEEKGKVKGRGGEAEGNREHS